MTTPTLRRVLFPTDFSPCAEGAYRHAAYLADRFGAELHVLHTVEEEDAPDTDWPERGMAPFQLSMADVCEDLGLPLPEADYDLLESVSVVEAEVVGPDVAGAVVDYAAQSEADLIVMGTHGRRGWRRGVLGSVAEAVLRQAPCPVLTVRSLDAPGDGAWPPRRVLVAVDALPYGGFDESNAPASARWAARLSVAYHAPLEIVHVTAPASFVIDGAAIVADDRVRAREALLGLADVLRAETGAHLPVEVLVRTGSPSDTIRAIIGEVRPHLLVVGTHGQSGPGRALLGSVAEDLVRMAPCPVLVARDALSDSDEPTERTRLEVAQ